MMKRRSQLGFEIVSNQTSVDDDDVSLYGVKMFRLDCVAAS